MKRSGHAEGGEPYNSERTVAPPFLADDFACNTSVVATGGQ
jgi:hypothetical protein